MKIKNKVSVLFVLLAMFFVFPNSLKAVDTPMEAAGFVKRVKHPENQITKGEALNLMMQPGQQQKVAIEVENLGDQKITLTVKLNGARTNSNGGLEYGPSSFRKDETMQYDLTDLVKVPAEVTLEPKEKKDFEIEIKMPEIAYDGIVTGGVQLMKKDGKTEEQEKGAVIVNKIAYLFGVTLRMTETPVDPDFELREVYPELQNYRNAIYVDVANTQPMIAENMAMNVQILKQGSKEVLYERKKTDVSVAPNSIMAYPVSMDGEKMKAGKYTANVVLKGYDREWTWTENFEISDEEADKFNQQDVYLVQERGLDWKKIALVAGSILALLLVITLLMIVMKKKSKSKQSSKKKKK